MFAFVLLVGCRLPETDPLPSTRSDVPAASLTGRVIAVGIPGVGAISPVGAFLAGGPIHDNPDFAAYTQPGRNFSVSLTLRM